MKTVILTAGSLMFGACDNGSSVPDYASACEAACENELECELLGDTTLEECASSCENEGTQMCDDFFSAYTECRATSSCTMLDDWGENVPPCYEQNVDLCTSDTTEYVEVACRAQLECDGVDDPTSAQLEECLETMRGDGNIIICFQQSMIDQTIRCIEAAESCTPDPVNDCALEVLGLVLGNSGIPSNQPGS